MAQVAKRDVCVFLKPVCVVLARPYNCTLHSPMVPAGGYVATAKAKG